MFCRGTVLHSDTIYDSTHLFSKYIVNTLLRGTKSFTSLKAYAHKSKGRYIVRRPPPQNSQLIQALH